MIKEHRIRLETPRLPLFDRTEKKLVENALKEATKKAKETYPIAPQLDVCRLLVAQDNVPYFTATTDPSEDVFFLRSEFVSTDCAMMDMWIV